MAIGDSTKKIPNSLIAMNSKSWDTVREILVREITTVNPVTGTAEVMTAIQGNPSMTLTYDGDGNLTTLTKTIDSTTYSKTFTWTGSRLTDISAWSVV